ncbi:exonuclease domain-containing protein [Streptomonospora litoralis]|uniref:Exonuclease n=1 Tax=Streptomonospora litoralis TaxID=2498135 RepID=A0A4P6Q3J8_9ACTN|nr:exonuclease domain-containing protein [Streptomonospora litoralis]QBI53469.1 Exonuclease [Streptomonospora litoralis]
MPPTDTAPRNLVFLDTETTGLDDERHEVWEIGFIVRSPLDMEPDEEHLYQVAPDLSTADPGALHIGGYYQRTQRTGPTDRGAVNLAAAAAPQWSDPRAVAELLAPILDQAVGVGALPDFDFRHLRRWLRRHGQCWSAHYHHIDIEPLVAGYLQAHPDLAPAGPPPWNSNQLSAAVGVDPKQYARHQALEDARWVRDQWDAVYTWPSLT